MIKLNENYLKHRNFIGKKIKFDSLKNEDPKHKNDEIKKELFYIGIL